MWDFNHDPLQSSLAGRYTLHLTAPAQCARQLLTGEADLGLIPIAALTPALAIVPGCTIASLHSVRSILLIVKDDRPLNQVRTVAADTASRSSVAYTEVLFRQFLQADPHFNAADADPEAMLRSNDAALLIGDPALLARERKAEIEASLGPCQWYDIAELWRHYTGLPWVAAVWAVRPEALPNGSARAQLIADLNQSRDHGLNHIEDLVTEWTPRIALPPETIRTYLTTNIHYHLDQPCIETITRFRALAATTGALEPLGPLRFLEL